MKAAPLKFQSPVCLVGGGVLTREMLAEAQVHAPVLVAADGAADRLAEWGLMPDAVVGDMDSIVDPVRWRDAVHFLEIEEQDSTDFAKCLYATEAPFYLAAGFTGRRVDHMLAVFSSMLAERDKTVILIGEAEVFALVPEAEMLNLSLEVGAIVSFYPLAPVTGVRSEGLKWPVDGLEMQAGFQIGTSNEAISSTVAVQFDGPGALLMLERRFLSPLVEALTG